MLHSLSIYILIGVFCFVEKRLNLVLPIGGKMRHNSRLNFDARMGE